MTKHQPADLLNPNSVHSGTPPGLNRTEARKPQMDPTVGVAVPVDPARPPAKHRLVTLGDSLTMGFQSLGTANTAISWPRVVAWELGLDESEFAVPVLRRYGGMPFNLEFLLRSLEGKVEPELMSPLDLAKAGMLGLAFYDEVSSFWREEWDQHISSERIHNIACWGWDVGDLMSGSAKFFRDEVASHFLYAKTAQARSSYRVMKWARRNGDEEEGTVSPVQAAKQLADDGGIETLVVMIGANNALKAVLNLDVTWTEDDNNDFRDPRKKQRFTVWQPKHFAVEFEALVRELDAIDAQNVILATVPHVTVPPVTQGITPGGHKVTAGSRYFEFYARPWVKDFDYRDDPCITAGQARAIDSAIDDYNELIERTVAAKRQAGKNWFLLEIAGLLDRLAARRYIEDPAARPSWWDTVGGAYPLPTPLADLVPKVDSHFFSANSQGRIQGGLFALDGVHPTTIGYGIIAQEVINVMHLAGVRFVYGNGIDRPGPVAVDFERLLRLDTLMSAPPPGAAGFLALIERIDSMSDRLFGLMF